MKTKNLVSILMILLFVNSFLFAQKMSKMNYKEESRKIIYEMKDLKFDSVYSRFDSVVSKMLTKDKLEATWKSFIQQVGPFQEILSDSSYMYQNFPMVQLKVKFEKMDFNFIFAFNSSDQLNTFRIIPVNAAVNYKLPTYAKKDNYIEKAVYIGKEWQLPGTLYLPKGTKKSPALVLVHGSGPNDRDETIGPNKVFKDIALGLASKGIAVLTYDKRTKVYPEKSMAISNFSLDDETIQDAIEAFNFLKQQSEVEPSKIFIAGHSLGAFAGPRIAEKIIDLAGLILMAAPSGKFEDLVYEQVLYISKLDDKISESEQEQLDSIKIQTERVKSDKLKNDTPSGDLLMGVPASYWLDLRNYDQLETAKKLKLPIYILQGERDYQVNMKNFEDWKSALNGKNNVQFKSYPKLYHLFIEGTGKSTPQEYMVEGHVAEYFIDDILNWINLK